MAEHPPEPDLGHFRRALRDSKDAWRSLPFIFCSAIAATAAAVVGAILPSDASDGLKVLLAAISAAGAPIVLGCVVFLVMLAMAPTRRQRDQLRKQVADLEVTSRLGEGSGTTIFAPNSTFILGDEGSLKENLPRPSEEEQES